MTVLDDVRADAFRLIVRPAQTRPDSRSIRSSPATAAAASCPGRAYQYAPVWWRDTYNPPPHTIAKSSDNSLEFLPEHSNALK